MCLSVDDLINLLNAAGQFLLGLSAIITVIKTNQKEKEPKRPKRFK